MNNSHDSIKLIVEERQRDLRTQYFTANQLKAAKISRASSKVLSGLGFLPGIRLSFLVGWLFPESHTSIESECEMRDGQITAECQSC